MFDEQLNPHGGDNLLHVLTKKGSHLHLKSEEELSVYLTDVLTKIKLKREIQCCSRK